MDPQSRKILSGFGARESRDSVESGPDGPYTRPTGSDGLSLVPPTGDFVFSGPRMAGVDVSVARALCPCDVVQPGLPTSSLLGRDAYGARLGCDWWALPHLAAGPTVPSAHVCGGLGVRVPAALHAGWAAGSAKGAELGDEGSVSFFATFASERTEPKSSVTPPVTRRRGDVELEATGSPVA